MKKIIQTILILAIATVAFMPVKTFAFTQEVNPAWGVNIQNIHNVVDPKFDDMQNQINALKAQCANPATTINYGSEQRLASLESRMTILEKTVDFIINQVSNVLAEVIKYLSK